MGYPARFGIHLQALQPAPGHSTLRINSIDGPTKM